MTPEQVQEMSRRVDEGKRLLGLITVAKERIAWLEEGRKLSIVFAKHFTEKSAFNEVAEPASEDVLEAARKLVLDSRRQELASLQDQFNAL